MAVLDIVPYGDPILRKICDPVRDFSILPVILEDLFDSMYAAEGIGLAANQVGLDLKLFVLDVSPLEEAGEPLVLVNGEILDSWGESVAEEGCLSIPEVRLEIKRPEFIRLRYQDLDQALHEEEFGGLPARAIQHEIDHLNGVYIIDRVSPVVRLQYQRQLKSITKNTRDRSRSQPASPAGFVL